MENNFIQMPASAGLLIANTIAPIFKHINDSRRGLVGSVLAY